MQRMYKKIYTIELEKKGLMFTEVSTVSSYNSQLPPSNEWGVWGA